MSTLIDPLRRMVGSSGVSLETLPSNATKENRSLFDAIRAFENWLERNGNASFDPYDIWGTGYGLKARRLYYSKPPLGLSMIAPILLIEIILPSLRRAFVKPKRFATADAQLALAFLNLHELTGETSYLQKAADCCEALIQSSIPGYSGFCWGYPFDWQHSGGCWPKNTPYATVTPYCYEAFARIAELTGEKRYLEIAASAARFMFRDLMNVKVNGESSASSYSPLAEDKVVNVSAYRAFVLFDAAARFGEPEYAQLARENLAFVLDAQMSDGSWWYEIDPPAKPFVDHFHTCFVLKCLYKINRLLRESRIEDAIFKGYAYYSRFLFRASGLPKSFAIEPRFQVGRLEMYDLAEAITLGTLLRDAIPSAFASAQRLGKLLCEQYQLPQGHFVTRVYRGGWRHTFPFIRWPQAQLFYALTNLVHAVSPPKHR